jgi:glycosyltransferase involved in cell wall biosynthesis
MKIVIFRNQLFKFSEPFIKQQANGVQQEKIFVGRKLLGNAENNEVITLSDESIFKNIFYVLFRNITPLKKKLISHKVDLIHAHFGVDAIYALNLAESLNVPLITTFHGFDVTTKSLSLVASRKPSWINFFIHKKVLADQGQLFICVSEFIRDKAIAMGFPEKRLMTHYIGIELKAVIHKVKNNKKILHVARLTEKKGTEFLISAISKLKSQDVILQIIGEGPLEKELKEKVKVLNIENRVEFLGSKSHETVLEYMHNCAIFSVPSVTAKNGDAEGLGMVFLEAATLEIPVVATLHGGIPEVVIDGVTGFLVPERNSTILAEKIQYLLDNPQERFKMGKAARKMVEDKFDIVKQSQKLEKIYKQVIDAYSHTN